MKKILQFMADGSAGGGATVLLGLAQDLLKDHQVHVLVETGSYVAKRSRELGATVHEGSFFGSVLAKGPAETVSRVIEQVSPDIVHYHGGRALFFGRRVNHPKAVYTVHGYHFLHRGVKDRLMGCFAERRSLGHIREIVFVCDYDRQLGIRAGLVPKGMKTRVVYNGVDLPDAPIECPSDKLKHIAYLNRLVYQKDPLLAIEVIRQLAPDGFKLVLIGGGDMEDWVRAAARNLGDAVQFIGSVPREEAMRLTSQCGAMLMTSRWEGLPLAPLEAMAMGVPVVAPAVSGIPEIVDSGINGELVEGRDPSDFAQALRRLCEPGPHREAITHAARDKVERVFSWASCLAGYRRVYADLRNT